MFIPQANLSTTSSRLILTSLPSSSTTKHNLNIIVTKGLSCPYRQDVLQSPPLVSPSLFREDDELGWIIHATVVRASRVSRHQSTLQEHPSNMHSPSRSHNAYAGGHTSASGASSVAFETK